MNMERRKRRKEGKELTMKRRKGERMRWERIEGNGRGKEGEKEEKKKRMDR